MYSSLDPTLLQQNVFKQADKGGGGGGDGGGSGGGGGGVKIFTFKKAFQKLIANSSMFIDNNFYCDS